VVLAGFVQVLLATIEGSSDAEVWACLPFGWHTLMLFFLCCRTEYKDDEIEFVLENISHLNILPSRVYIRNITDIAIQTLDLG
jgi:hypothetical protein